MMETVLDATARLREQGYSVDFTATGDGHLRCGACGASHDPAEMVLDEVARFEGDSNPDDESILLAMRCECGQAGLFSSAFGPNASSAAVAVFERLP